MSDISHRLQSLSIFRCLPEKELLVLSKECQLHHIAIKEALYLCEDEQKSVFIVLTGSVRIQVACENRDTKILYFLSRGEILGIETLWTAKPRYDHSAVVNEDVTAIEIPLERFKALLLVRHPLLHEVHTQWTRRLQELQADLCSSQSLASYRIAQFFLRILKQQPVAFGGRIQIPLNRMHIGQKVGSQSETVIRILSDWTKAAWITTNEHHIEVLDSTALAKIRHHRRK